MTDFLSNFNVPAADGCDHRSHQCVGPLDDPRAMPLLVDVHGVATLLAVSPRTIHRLVENGKLPHPDIASSATARLSCAVNSPN